MLGRRPPPDPGLGPSVELRRCSSSRLIHLAPIAKILPCQCLPPQQPPPALDQVEPAGFGGDKDLLDTWACRQPLPDGAALVTGQVIGDQIQLACRIGPFDGVEQRQIAHAITRRGRERQRLPVVYLHCSINPDLVKPPALLQGRLDAVPIR